LKCTTIFTLFFFLLINLPFDFVINLICTRELLQHWAAKQLSSVILYFVLVRPIKICYILFYIRYVCTIIWFMCANIVSRNYKIALWYYRWSVSCENSEFFFFFQNYLNIITPFKNNIVIYFAYHNTTSEYPPKGFSIFI